MVADEIREWLNREPFEPFRIHLTSGDSYDVREPNAVALGRRWVFLFFPRSDRKAYFPYLHIAALETIENGQRRKRRR